MATTTATTNAAHVGEVRYERNAFIVMLVAFLAMPFVIYPNFAMQLLCFALQRQLSASHIAATISSSLVISS